MYLLIKFRKKGKYILDLFYYLLNLNLSNILSIDYVTLNFITHNFLST